MFLDWCRRHAGRRDGNTFQLSKKTIEVIYFKLDTINICTWENCLVAMLVTLG